MMHLGAATPAALVDQLNVDLVRLLVEMNLKLQSIPGNPQIKGQLATAVGTLNNVINGPFSRLAPKAKAGDADALRRLQHISQVALTGMQEILDEIEQGSSKNLTQLRQDILRDLNRLGEEVARTAGGAAESVGRGLVKGAPWLVTAAVVGGVVWLLSKLGGGR